MMNAGRKRAFDKEQALDKAMRVFWENGFTGTSITDLTTALGINKPSLYAAFGNKEKLFEASLERYVQEYGLPRMQPFSTPSDKPLKQRLKSCLYGIIDLQTDPDTPKGCFLVKSNCESGSDDFPNEMSSLLEGINKNTEKFLAEFLQTEHERGAFPDDVSIEQASGYLIAILYGLAVQARAGKSKKELRSSADFAVSTFPGCA